MYIYIYIWTKKRSRHFQTSLGEKHSAELPEIMAACQGAASPRSDYYVLYIYIYIYIMMLYCNAILYHSISLLYIIHYMLYVIIWNFSASTPSDSQLRGV